MYSIAVICLPLRQLGFLVSSTFPVIVVQKLSKVVKICQSYWHELLIRFLWTNVCTKILHYMKNF